jgi:hypothetical protein
MDKPKFLSHKLDLSSLYNCFLFIKIDIAPRVPIQCMEIEPENHTTKTHNFPPPPLFVLQPLAHFPPHRCPYLASSTITHKKEKEKSSLLEIVIGP